MEVELVAGSEVVALVGLVATAVLVEEPISGNCAVAVRVVLELKNHQPEEDDEAATVVVLVSEVTIASGSLGWVSASVQSDARLGFSHAELVHSKVWSGCDGGGETLFERHHEDVGVSTTEADKSAPAPGVFGRDKTGDVAGLESTFSVSMAGSLSLRVEKLKLGPSVEWTEPMSWKSGVWEIAEMEAMDETGMPFWAMISGELEGVELLLQGRLWVLLLLLLLLLADCECEMIWWV